MNTPGRTWALTAIGGGALAVVLSACGSATITSTAPSTDPTDTAIARLYTTIAGTDADRSAQDYINYRTLQDGLVSCMKKAGYTYARPNFFDMWASYQTDGSLDDSRWLAPLNYPVVSIQAQYLAAVRRAVDAWNSTPADASIPDGPTAQGFNPALNTCSDETPTTSSASNPPHLAGLIGSFHDMVDRVDAQVSTDTSHYSKCMSGQGYEVEDYSGLRNLIRVHLPRKPEQTPLPGQQGNDAWQKGLDYESAALKADADCRQTEHATGMQLLEDATADYARDHHNELAAMSAEWAKVVATANAYPGSPGFGDAKVVDTQ